MAPKIRTLTETDAEALYQLRGEALATEPESFKESLAEYQQSTPDQFAQRLRSRSPDNFVLGAFDADVLVGMAGFYRFSAIKQHHKGSIWGVYLRPTHRGRRLGSELLSRTLAEIRNSHGLRAVSISVATTQHAARQLYKSHGFRTYGIERRAFQVDGRFIDVEFMELDLQP